MAPYPVTEALHRAAHTLSGIAKTAGVRQGIKVAEPMEHYVRKLHDNGHGLPEEGLLLLRDTVYSLENVVEHVEEDTGYFPDHGRLIAGWHALERSLDAELARLAEAGERTVADVWRPDEVQPGAAAESRPKPKPKPTRCSRKCSGRSPESRQKRPGRAATPAVTPPPSGTRSAN